jgi:hypothetical protein
MKKYILAIIFIFPFAVCLPAHADKCELSCPNGENSIECTAGCGCICNDAGQADCFCTDKKTCTVDCPKGSDSISCDNACGCVCDDDGSPVCQCN